MTVYIVVWHFDDSNDHIDGVVRNKEDAEQFIKNSKYARFYEVEEYELK